MKDAALKAPAGERGKESLDCIAEQEVGAK
jgi:hypothetical protein